MWELVACFSHKVAPQSIQEIPGNTWLVDVCRCSILSDFKQLRFCLTNHKPRISEIANHVHPFVEEGFLVVAQTISNPNLYRLTDLFFCQVYRVNGGIIHIQKLLMSTDHVMYHAHRNDVENGQVCWDVHYSFLYVVQKLEYIPMVIYKQQKTTKNVKITGLV